MGRRLCLTLWGDHTGPNERPFVFSIRKWCDLKKKLAECPSECVFPNVLPNAFRLFSECFQTEWHSGQFDRAINDVIVVAVGVVQYF